jgi:phosphoribosylglycinamide formyltransferase-1
MKRVAVLISGRGSNMTVLADRLAKGDLPAELAIVISNVAGAPGLERAAERGIPTAVVPHKGKDRKTFETELQGVLTDAGAELICLAGFMRILSAEFTDRWEGRMLNIHPSLLPAFRGLHVHEQALEAGVAVSGCTVHLVTSELDGGPILGQAVVPVLSGDTPDSLAARVQKAEHVLYPAALSRLLGGASQHQLADDILLSLR